MKNQLTGLSRLAFLYIGVVGWALGYFCPYDIVNLMTRFAITEAQSSWIVTGELLALAFSAIAVGSKIGYLNKRKCIATGCMVALAGLALSLFTPTLPLVVSGKILFGVGLGVVVASVYAIPAYFAEHEKLFAQSSIALALFYGITMYFVPDLFQLLGEKALEWVEVGMILVAILIHRALPTAITRRTPIATSGQRLKLNGATRLKIGLALLGCLGLFVTQGANISFTTPAADALRVSPEELATAYSMMAFLQLPAGIALAWLGAKQGYMRPLIAGYLLLMLVAWGLYLSGSAPWFIFGVVAISAGGSIVSTYQLSTLAALDETGRAPALGGGLINIGMGIGPALAGFIISTLGMPAIGTLSIVVLLISAGISVYAAANYGKRSLSVTTVSTTS